MQVVLCPNAVLCLLQAAMRDLIAHSSRNCVTMAGSDMALLEESLHEFVRTQQDLDTKLHAALQR